MSKNLKQMTSLGKKIIISKPIRCPIFELLKAKRRFGPSMQKVRTGYHYHSMAEGEVISTPGSFIMSEATAMRLKGAADYV
jgi:hypothetical protein